MCTRENGTAEIFKNSPKVFTFSMHGANNFPFRKEKSDLDLPLPDGIGDDEYLELLKNTLPDLISTHEPEFYILSLRRGYFGYR